MDIPEKNLNHETPFYIFDREIIRLNYQRFEKLIPGIKIHYAVKSNPLPEIAKTLNAVGSGFEVASPNELKMLLEQGVEPSRIICSAPVKSGKFIHYAHQVGIQSFAFDSKEELERITQSAPKSQVYLRLLVTEHGSRFSLSEKFGVSIDRAASYMAYAKELGLKPTGLTFHIGSQATSVYSWRYAIRTAAKAMNLLQEKGLKIKTLNLGGGFPVSYLEEEPSLEEIANSIKIACKKYLPYQVTLMAEPGRALVAESAVLVTTIFGRVKRGRETWLYTDAGAYNSLFESLESQTALEYPVKAIGGAKGRLKNFVITGPTCDSIDVIRRKASLPAELHVGDRLMVLKAGAYTVALANSFNGFEPPKVYFIN